MSDTELQALEDNPEDALREAIQTEKLCEATARRRKKALETELARLICPFKVGSVIEWGGRRVYRGTVVSVTLAYGDYVKIHAAAIRKDGTTGAVRTVRHYDNPRKPND